MIIRFIQKLVILWEKSKFLTLMELESRYLQGENQEILERDLIDLRGQLAKQKLIKNPTAEVKHNIVDIEAQINETEKYRQMIASSVSKSEDLRKQIKLYKKQLWK